MKCSGSTLQKILDLAVSEGFLTPNASKDGIDHSKGFLFSKENSSFVKSFKKKDLAIDLGSGGGLPGLVLSAFTACFWLLTDRSEKRCTFLKRGVWLSTRSARSEATSCYMVVYNGHVTMIM